MEIKRCKMRICQMPHRYGQACRVRNCLARVDSCSILIPRPQGCAGCAANWRFQFEAVRRKGASILMPQGPSPFRLFPTGSAGKNAALDGGRRLPQWRGQLPRGRPDPESERGTQPRFARFAFPFEVLETPPMREFESISNPPGEP